MKFTKLIAASFAVLTLFSCTRELIDAGQLNFAPGDAVLVLNLSKPTTYSTTDNERAIVGTTGAKVYKENGTEIVPTSVDMTGGKMTIVIAAADYVAGDKVDVYLYANGAPAVAGATGDDQKAATVGTAIDRELTAGAPAGYYETVTLTAGTTPLAQLPGSNNKSQLKRAIARVDVVNGSKWYTDETYATEAPVQSAAGGGVQIPITDYKVDFTQVNLTLGLMYGGMTNATSAVEGKGTASHTITGVVAGMYKSRETLAYMYPSENVVARVSVPPTVTGANTPSPITFSPAANKNYTIKITPFKTTDGSITTDWEIDPGYDEDVDLGEVNFNDDVISTGFFIINIPGATASGSRVSLNAMTSVANHDLDLSELAFDADRNAETEDWTALDKVTSITVGNSPNSNYLSITANVAANRITVSASPNYTMGSFTIPVTVSGKIGTNEYTSTFDVVLSALTKEEREALDAGTVEMGADKFMMLGTTGNAYDDLQNYIKVKQAGGFNDATIKANGYSVIADKDKSLFFSGGTIGKAYTDCPKGYKNPTVQEFCDGVFGGSARNYTGQTSGTKWASTVDVPENLSNSVILTKKYSDTMAGGFAYYTVERNGRTMYLFGSVGYMCNSSRWYDNSTTGIGVGNKINIAPWSDGLAFTAADPTFVPAAAAARVYPCIVDKSYNGGLK